MIGVKINIFYIIAVLCLTLVGCRHSPFSNLNDKNDLNACNSFDFELKIDPKTKTVKIEKLSAKPDHAGDYTLSFEHESKRIPLIGFSSGKLISPFIDSRLVGEPNPNQPPLPLGNTSFSPETSIYLFPGKHLVKFKTQACVAQKTVEIPQFDICNTQLKLQSKTLNSLREGTAGTIVYLPINRKTKEVEIKMKTFTRADNISFFYGEEGSGFSSKQFASGFISTEDKFSTNRFAFTALPENPKEVQNYELYSSLDKSLQLRQDNHLKYMTKPLQSAIAINITPLHNDYIAREKSTQGASWEISGITCFSK